MARSSFAIPHGYIKGAVEITKLNFKCPKCENTDHEIGEIRVSGGFWSAIFDVQGRRFSSVTCTRCKYTEMYKTDDASKLGKIFDLFTN